MLRRCIDCPRHISPVTDRRAKDGLRLRCRTCAADSRKREAKARAARDAARRAKSPQRKMLSSARIRARRRNLACTLGVEDIVIPSHCPVLGLPLRSTPTPGGDDRSPSLDRIEASKGYVPGNVLVVSNRVNRIKNDATVAELEQIAAFYRARCH